MGALFQIKGPQLWTPGSPSEEVVPLWSNWQLQVQSGSCQSAGALSPHICKPGRQSQAFCGRLRRGWSSIQPVDSRQPPSPGRCQLKVISFLEEGDPPLLGIPLCWPPAYMLDHLSSPQQHLRLVRSHSTCQLRQEAQRLSNTQSHTAKDIGA